MGNCFISLENLASICLMHPQSIQMHRAGARIIKLLEGLPAPVRTRPFLLWLKSDIESWLSKKSTLAFTNNDEEKNVESIPAQNKVVETTTFARRKPGRPKKKSAVAERHAARAGGAS